MPERPLHSSELFERDVHQLFSRSKNTPYSLQIGHTAIEFPFQARRLDRYVPKAGRESVHVQVKLKESKAKDKNQRTCEVVMHVPGETITVSETTINMFAAIDIAETKLRNSLAKYKGQQANPRLHQRVLAHFKHRPA